MSLKLKAQKKLILSDPLTAFSTHDSDAKPDDKTRLKELWEQLQSQNKQYRAIQAQTNILSRQIGEAKKNRQSANKLIQSMQQHSIQRKQLINDRDHVEQQILDFFIVNEDDDSQHKPSPNTHSEQAPTDRHYTTAAGNPGEITIRIDKHKHNEWNDYVSNQSAATIHHRAEWQDLLKKTYGLNSFYFSAYRNNQIVGVLPLVRLKSRLFGDLLVSMPYFQRGGAVADHPLIEHQLMQAANNHAGQLKIGHVEYRDDIPREALQVLSHKVNMVLSLPGSEDILWKGFTAKLRAQIKRPQRAAPHILIGGKEHLDDFYKVYTHNMRDLGSPAHSKLFVSNILESFPDNSWIVVLRLNNKPVSAGLLLGHSNTMEIPLASTLREANPLSMNMLLYWEALKLATRQGYKAFDFGRSTKNAGTYRFKQQWGAEPKQLYWHYWLSENNELPSLNPSNPKYALIIKLWKRLPVSLSRWLGPLIVKNIP